MDNRMHWADRPLWVRIGLFGMPSRKAAMFWMNGTLAFIAVFLIAIFVVPISIDTVPVSFGTRLLVAVLSGMVMLMAPLWYWLAIHWTDEHNGWALHTWKS